jgi:hypothetical protein
MDFFTHFSKNTLLNFVKKLMGGVALFLFSITSSHAAIDGVSVANIASLQIERFEGGFFLNAQLKFDIPPVVQDVLNKGIPLIFVAEADVRRERWYWYDKKIIIATRQMRLAYQPLTRRWRLNITNNTDFAAGLGNGLGGGLPQYFDTLPEALTKIQRISRLRILDVADIDSDASYILDLSFKLDVSQLPRPFQIGLIGQSDWNISTSKSIRFTPEAIK